MSLLPLLRFYFSLKILNKFECCTVSSLVEIGQVVRSREEVFLNVVNLSLVLWERCGSSFEQLNWIESSLPMEYFLPSLVKTDPVVLQKKYFRCCQLCNVLVRNLYHHFEKGLVFLLSKFYHWCFLLSLVKLNPVVLERWKRGQIR